jgi:ribonuclease HI
MGNCSEEQVKSRCQKIERGFIIVQRTEYTKKANNVWEERAVLRGRRTRQAAYGHRRAILSPPDNILPITTYQKGEDICIDGKGVAIKVTDITRPEWDRTSTHIVMGSISNMIESIQQTGVIIMSDGSVKGNKATAAWIISTEDCFQQEQFIQGQWNITNDKYDSHRAESYGILGGLKTWKYNKEKWDIPVDCNITISCDNKSAIQFAGDIMSYPNISSKFPDFDVLQEIRAELRGSTFEYMWIKGHQDRGNAPLDTFALMNIKANDVANECRQSDIQPLKETMFKFATEKWQIHVDGRKIHKDLEKEIREHISVPDIREYWDHKKRVTKEQFHNVSWNSLQKVMKALTTQTKHWIIKRAARDCGANAVLHRRRQKAHDFLMPLLWKSRNSTTCLPMPTCDGQGKVGPMYCRITIKTTGNINRASNFVGMM